MIKDYLRLAGMAVTGVHGQALYNLLPAPARDKFEIVFLVFMTIVAIGGF